MGTVIAWILGICTVLGGIAAVGYFRDKWRKKQEWNENDKVVNNNWWESSDLKKQYEARGYKEFGWSNSDRVRELIAEGKELVFETDEESRTKYRIVNKSDQVLVAAKLPNKRVESDSLRRRLASPPLAAHAQRYMAGSNGYRLRSICIIDNQRNPISTQCLIVVVITTGGLSLH